MEHAQPSASQVAQAVERIDDPPAVATGETKRDGVDRDIPAREVRLERRTELHHWQQARSRVALASQLRQVEPGWTAGASESDRGGTESWLRFDIDRRGEFPCHAAAEEGGGTVEGDVEIDGRTAQGDVPDGPTDEPHVAASTSRDALDGVEQTALWARRHAPQSGNVRAPIPLLVC